MYTNLYTCHLLSINSHTQIHYSYTYFYFYKHSLLFTSTAMCVHLYIQKTEWVRTMILTSNVWTSFCISFISSCINNYIKGGHSIRSVIHLSSTSYFISQFNIKHNNCFPFRILTWSYGCDVKASYFIHLLHTHLHHSKYFIKLFFLAVYLRQLKFLHVFFQFFLHIKLHEQWT